MNNSIERRLSKIENTLGALPTSDAARMEQAITQEHLAELLGVSVEFVSNMERGINAPSFETLEKLAIALDLQVSDLFIFEKENS